MRAVECGSNAFAHAWRRRLGALPAVCLLGLALRPAPALACVGDCDGDGTVAIDELVAAVNIALGSAALSTCPAIDPNGDGTATITELVIAVDDALDGCPPIPTATPINSPTHTPIVTATVTVLPTNTPTRTPTVTPTSTATSIATATSRAMGTGTPTPANPTATPVAACYGDCNGNGAVTIVDLVDETGIALGISPLSDCQTADANQDGTVDVSELITSVGEALRSCPATPFPRLDLACDNGAIVASSSPLTQVAGEGIVSISSVSGAPGSQVTFAVTLQNSFALSIGGIQNDIAFDSINAPVAAQIDHPDIPDCTVNPGINKMNTSFRFEPVGCSGTSCTSMRAIVFAAGNLNVIPDDSVLYTCNVEIAAGAPQSSFPLTCSDVIAGSVPPPTPTPTITPTPTPTEALAPGEVELQVGSAVGAPDSQVEFDVRLRTTRSVTNTARRAVRLRRFQHAGNGASGRASPLEHCHSGRQYLSSRRIDAVRVPRQIPVIPAGWAGCR